jgi:hypothetical protein
MDNEFDIQYPKMDIDVYTNTNTNIGHGRLGCKHLNITITRDN